MLISSLIIPLGKPQSKQYRRFASPNSIIATPMLIAGHILLPDPNGKNSKSWPLKSMELSINLSG
ncbi:hypothetical protein ACHQM5_025846 [Ranunculus cassubicifolius]